MFNGMDQDILNFLVSAANLGLIVMIPIEFIIGVVLTIGARMQKKELGYSPVGKAGSWIWAILAFQTMMVIGLNVLVEDLFSNTVEYWWTELLNWLGQKTPGTTGGGTASMIFVFAIMLPKRFFSGALNIFRR